jgi:hypothetical protein
VGRRREQQSNSPRKKEVSNRQDHRTEKRREGKTREAEQPLALPTGRSADRSRTPSVAHLGHEFSAMNA